MQFENIPKKPQTEELCKDTDSQHAWKVLGFFLIVQNSLIHKGKEQSLLCEEVALNNFEEKNGN